MPLTIEQQLTKHELKDEERFGSLEKHLVKQDAKLDTLLERTKKTEGSVADLEDEIEDTKQRELNLREARIAYWRDVAVKVLVGILLAAAGWAVGHLHFIGGK